MFNNYIGHWVKDGELKQACLSVQVVNESHTGEFIANQIKETLKKAGKCLDDPSSLRQVAGSTTDTAANERNAGYNFFLIILIIT